MSKLSLEQFVKSKQYSFEYKIRGKACLVIKKSGILLKLKQSTTNTAQILLQKYYYVESFKSLHVQDVISGVLFISTKIQEDPKSIKEIIKSVHFILFSKKLNDLEFYQLKSRMEKAELEILINLGFNVSVQQPSGFLLNILNSLGLIQKQEIVQSCINYLNDALLTHVYLVYNPVTLACGSIHLSCKILKVGLYKKWYVLFDVCLKDLQDFSLVMMDLYKFRELNDSTSLLSLIDSL